MKNQIIPQEKLQNSLVYFHEELNMYVTDSYKIAKKFQMTARNAREIVSNVLDSYLSLNSNMRKFAGEISHTVTERNNIEKFDISTHIIFSDKIITDRGRIIDGYYLSELGYTLVLQQISTPKLEKTKFIASLAKLEFSQAFFLMRDIIKNQPQPKFKKVDIKNFGKLSKANKLHGRTEEVRGYFRSDRNKELSRLYGERTRLQNRLGGLMDLDILEQLKELDIKIDEVQKTPIQEELSNPTRLLQK